MYQAPLEDIEADSGMWNFTFLSAIVNSSDDAIVGKTPDGVITSWNPGAERMYGYRAAEIVGQPMTVLCPPERTGEIKEILQTVSRGERVVHFETERRRKDGTVFPVSVTVSPIHDGGRLIGASSVARDITDQRERRAQAAAVLHSRADDLERANRNLETFSYSVAHDLRAPLRAMGGFSAALVEEFADVLGEVGRGYASASRRQVSR